jgi:uncharacterized protein
MLAGWSCSRKDQPVKDISLSPTANAADETVAARPWVWSQHWINLLFLHWRIPVDALLPHVPSEVTIDTVEGWGWVSLVLFQLKVRPRWLPFVPCVSTFNELNLRTYVCYRDRPGIGFLSIHANNRWAIRLARWLTPLPYLPARIRYQEAATGFSFDCWDLALPDCRSSIRFSPEGHSWQPQDGTLDAWLLERYRLFILGKCRRLHMAEVVHPRWTIRRARARILANTIGSPFDLDLSRSPDLVHFSSGVTARFGAFQRADF